MSVHTRDLDALLGALVAALPAPADGQHGSASWRFAERWGVPGVVVCRDRDLASTLSAGRGGDTVLHSMVPLVSLLAEGDGPPVEVLFLDGADPGKDDLRLKGADAPALVVAALPQAPWRRRWASNGTTASPGLAVRSCSGTAATAAGLRRCAWPLPPHHRLPPRVSRASISGTPLSLQG